MTCAECFKGTMLSSQVARACVGPGLRSGFGSVGSETEAASPGLVSFICNMGTMGASCDKSVPVKYWAE